MFDTNLLTEGELKLLSLYTCYHSPNSISPYATICKLRTALLDIEKLPASRMDSARLIAFRALDGFMESAR